MISGLSIGRIETTPLEFSNYPVPLPFRIKYRYSYSLDSSYSFRAVSNKEYACHSFLFSCAIAQISLFAHLTYVVRRYVQRHIKSLALEAPGGPVEMDDGVGEVGGEGDPGEVREEEAGREMAERVESDDRGQDGAPHRSDDPQSPDPVLPTEVGDWPSLVQGELESAPFRHTNKTNEQG